MMKIVIIYFCMTIFSFVNGQNFEVTYKVKLRSEIHEMYYKLIIDGDNSDFFLITKKNELADNLGIKTDKRINTCRRKDSLFIISNEVDFYLKAILPQKIQWEIQKENSNIVENNFNLHEAISIYNDKKVKAFFIKDINLPEGPFIFKGLPGLIYSIENENYSFQLVEIKKGNESVLKFPKNKIKIISLEKYKEYRKQMKIKEGKMLNEVIKLLDMKDAKVSDFSVDEPLIQIL